jgi:hypothetical protein
VLHTDNKYVGNMSFIERKRTCCINPVAAGADVIQHANGTQIRNMLHWPVDADTTRHPVYLFVPQHVHIAGWSETILRKKNSMWYPPEAVGALLKQPQHFCATVGTTCVRGMVMWYNMSMSHRCRTCCIDLVDAHTTSHPHTLSILVLPHAHVERWCDITCCRQKENEQRF